MVSHNHRELNVQQTPRSFRQAKGFGQPASAIGAIQTFRPPTPTDATSLTT